MRALPRASCLFAFSVLLGCAQLPEQPSPPPAAAAPAGTTPLAQLEAIFWACDYVATTQGVDATPMAQCAIATRELRRVKFANSFHALLDWWRENKTAEHERERQSRAGQPL
jgi:hypothetical protein